MKLSIKKFRFLTLIGILATATTGSVRADAYYVTAFDKGHAFKSLMQGDATRATATFAQLGNKRLSYADTNNLCVSQVLSDETSKAIGSCLTAISKMPMSLDLSTRKLRASTIYTNLGVAKAMEGDMRGALEALEEAMSLDPKNRNATRNYELLSVDQIAAN